MKQKKLVSYHKKNNVNKHCTLIEFGSAKNTDKYNEETNEHEIEVYQTVDEFTFYYAYLTINNITIPKAQKIPPARRILLCAIMCKPLDFNLTVDAKDSKLTDIAAEISSPGDIKTPNSVYQSIKRLKENGHLIQTEDKLIVLSAKLQRVRYAVKTQLEENDIATFDYLFKSYIKKADDNEKSDQE